MTRCFILAVLLTGCGKPATVQECEEIIERITRLELEERGQTMDSKAVVDEVESTKRAMHDKTRKECVGRRITEAAMQCVRNAKHANQVKECFD
jgi:hypothetical protein